MRSDVAPTRQGNLELQLFGWWDLRAQARSVELGGREQRLVALLALRGRKPRSQIAGTLWPDTTDERALTSLRSAVLRVRRSASGLLDFGQSTLAIAPDVHVDVQRVCAFAGEVDDHVAKDPRWWVGVLRDAELLPGWYEDWVVFERERLQHLRLAALESVARRALDVGHHDLALTAALAAIAIEPLRESAHLLVIRSHLLSGNHSEAIREYQVYRQQLRRVLAIDPSEELVSLLRPLVLPLPRQPR